MLHLLVNFFLFPFSKTGFVISIMDGVATIINLKLSLGSLVKFENGALGSVLDFKPRYAKIAIYDYELVRPVKIGMRVLPFIGNFSITPSFLMLGKLITPLGKTLNIGSNFMFSINLFSGKYNYELSSKLLQFKSTHERFIDRYGIVTNPKSRAMVNTPLETGIRFIDSLFPIGRGQRQLIVGDNNAGKTTIGFNIIINQRRNNQYMSIDGYGVNRMFAIYVAIGQRKTITLGLHNILDIFFASWYTTIIFAGASDSAAMQYVAPYSGMSLAEYFRDNGLNVVIIFDDFNQHAYSYRQLSLILRKSPGRDAYPSDIFYIHARLLERIGKLSLPYNFGSVTAFPIVETQEQDVSAFLPTNLISITDGQIYLNSFLFSQGLRPAVDRYLSVSRIGMKTQPSLLKFATKTLRPDLVQFSKVSGFLHSDDDVDVALLKPFYKGLLWQEILNQHPSCPQFLEEQAFLF